MKTCKMIGCRHAVTRPNKLFCSDLCRLQYWRLSRYKPTYAKCLTCGWSFERKRETQMYCSAACRQKAWRKHHPEYRAARNYGVWGPDGKINGPKKPAQNYSTYDLDFLSEPEEPEEPEVIDRRSLPLDVLRSNRSKKGPILSLRERLGLDDDEDL